PRVLHRRTLNPRPNFLRRTPSAFARRRDARISCKRERVRGSAQVRLLCLRPAVAVALWATRTFPARLREISAWQAGKRLQEIRFAIARGLFSMRAASDLSSHEFSPALLSLYRGLAASFVAIMHGFATR